jgi:hypothetical protein
MNLGKIDKSILSILINMKKQGIIFTEDESNMSAYSKTNESNIIIEYERIKNKGNIWNNNINNRYVSFIRFKDTITNICLLELTIYNIDEIILFIDLVNEWFSFNCSYDMVFPLSNNINNHIRQNIHFSIENTGEFIDDNGYKNYIKEYFLLIEQYDNNSEMNITRIKVSMGTDETYIQDMIDTMFFVFCLDLPYFEDTDFIRFYMENF